MRVTFTGWVREDDPDMDKRHRAHRRVWKNVSLSVTIGVRLKQYREDDHLTHRCFAYNFDTGVELRAATLREIVLEFLSARLEGRI